LFAHSEQAALPSHQEAINDFRKAEEENVAKLHLARDYLAIMVSSVSSVLAGRYHDHQTLQPAQRGLFNVSNALFSMISLSRSLALDLLLKISRLIMRAKGLLTTSYVQTCLMRRRVQGGGIVF
jgi:hypothetical protein